MNCQGIARLLDEQEVDGLLAQEQSDVQAHLATCRDCTRDWQIHAQLAGAAIPAVPPELRARYAAQAADTGGRGARRNGRFIVIGTFVALAAAAAMLISQRNAPPALVAGVADPVRVEPAEIAIVREAPPSPDRPKSEAVVKVEAQEKVQAQWMNRTAEWLSRQDDPDALIAAARLVLADPGAGADRQRIQSLLGRAMAMAPDSARIHATAFLVCRAAQPCDTAPYEQALRQVAPNNALGWDGEVLRASLAADPEALRSAIVAMSQAKTFDTYEIASDLSMIEMIRAARVAPSDAKGASRGVTRDGIPLEETSLPIPAYLPIEKFCKSATDEDTVLACRRTGAAMQAGDTITANMIGMTISGYGLSAESDEVRTLERKRKQLKWMMYMVQTAGGFSETEIDPRLLIAMARHPRQIDSIRAILEDQGIPTEPPADWKP